MLRKMKWEASEMLLFPAPLGVDVLCLLRPHTVPMCLYSVVLSLVLSFGGLGETSTSSLIPDMLVLVDSESKY